MEHTEKNQDNIRVLLVDDEEGFLNVLSCRLGRRFIKTIKTFSGMEAIQMLRKSEFDVVVLDLKMEGMDGIEVLRKIKKFDSKLPVIILTGHGSLAIEEEVEMFGAFDYLSKPCELVVLMDKIQEAWQSRKDS